MSSFEEQIAKYHNWTADHCRKVVAEYERFLQLKASNHLLPLSASDDIDKLWHFHILCTESYYNYCTNKYGKFIHHNLVDSSDQAQRQQRLINTNNCYRNTFGGFLYPEVWNVKVDTTLDALETIFQSSMNMKQVHGVQNIPVPSYASNKPLSGNFKLFIWFDNQSNAGSYNKEIIPMSLSDSLDSIDKLKELIVLHLKVTKSSVTVFPHPELPTLPVQPYLMLGELKQFTWIKHLLAVGCDFFVVKIGNEHPPGILPAFSTDNLTPSPISPLTPSSPFSSPFSFLHNSNNTNINTNNNISGSSMNSFSLPTSSLDTTNNAHPHHNTRNHTFR